MSFTSILRKPASTLAPLASRLNRVGRRQNYQSALLAAVERSQSNSPPKNASPVSLLRRYYSTAADTKKPSSTESLLRVIEAEIKAAEETDDHSRVEEIPEGFPFKIEDIPGQQILVLTREYEGELVKVEVHMPDLVTGEENERYEDDNDDGGGSGTHRLPQSSLPLFVTISKHSGTCLEFQCMAYPDEIAIDSVSIQNSENSEDQSAYEGPDFLDLDNNLRSAFHKYLEIRGIKPSTTNFLHEYMINKDSRESLGWLKGLRNFIEA